MLEIDISIRQGSFTLEAAFAAQQGITVIAGPSGSGKTTLASGLAGLVRPDTGTIKVGGRTLFDAASKVDSSPASRRVGYVVQDALLFPHMSVEANLTYGRRGGPLDLSEVVRILGLKSLLKRRPRALSGGERQRVALGRALLTNPAFLVLDEPFAGLDASRRNDLLPFIERIRERLSIPIVYVTHSWTEIIRLADTLILLNDGRVSAAGPLRDVLLEAGPSLAHLLPDGSVIEATVAAQRDSGLLRLDTPAGALFLADAPADPGETVRIFIDAHDVALALERPEGVSIQNILEGVIRSLTPIGNTHQDVLIALSDGQTLRARITNRAAHSLGLEPNKVLFSLIKSVALDRELQSDHPL